MPKIKIEKGILAMHDQFDVDRKKIAELMDEWGVTSREIAAFEVVFNRFSYNKDSRIAGWYKHMEQSIHIVAGAPTNFVYGGTTEKNFENIMLHEFGHYLHVRCDGAAERPDPRNELIAEAHVETYREAAGKLVHYSFKDEFIDCSGKVNLSDTWQNIDAYTLNPVAA